MKIHFLQKVNLFSFLLFITLIFTAHACKKCKCKDALNPECENYNPCLNQAELTADFTMKEVLEDYTTYDSRGNPVEFLIESSDTVGAVTQVEFEPKLKDLDSVKWMIGSEILTSKKFRRTYFPKNEQIPVTLIAYRHIGECKLWTKTIDTFTKSIISLYASNYPIFGFFKGYNTDNIKDTFTIQIGDTTHFTSNPRGWDLVFGHEDYISNFPKGVDGESDAFGRYRAGAKSLLISRDKGDLTSPMKLNPITNCGLLGLAVVDKGNLNFEYSYCDKSYQCFLTGLPFVGNNVWINKTFVGKKINP
jgi:hypothetical protein